MNHDRLKFIEELEAHREAKSNAAWLEMQKRTDERLRCEREQHAGVLGSRRRH